MCRCMKRFYSYKKIHDILTTLLKCKRNEQSEIDITRLPR